MTIIPHIKTLLGFMGLLAVAFRAHIIPFNSIQIVVAVVAVVIVLAALHCYSKTKKQNGLKCANQRELEKEKTFLLFLLFNFSKIRIGSGPNNAYTLSIEYEQVLKWQ